MTEEHLDTYLSPDILIELAKAKCNIKKPDSEMTDAEIGEVMRHIGSYAPDTVWIDDRPTFGRIGIGIMLSLALYGFQSFYTRHELSQFN